MATTTLNRQQNVQSEQDTRLGMLNTLLTTPHRDLAKIFPVHQEMIKQDPLFYVRLAVWYNDTGEVRDHKEMFIVSLCLSDFEGHRDVGLAMLRELPPYQLSRVVDFIHGRRDKKIVKTVTGVGKNRKTTNTVTVEQFGLNRAVPRSIRTEVARYLAERETEADWFDSTVLVARKSLKRLYALLHIKPGERAQKILFDEMPPDDSRLAAVKALRKAETPAEQARIIVENKVPYRMASTIVTAMTPTVLLALVEVMSDQELINNLGSLKKRGAFDNPELKQVISDRLEKAKKGKRVQALKASTARDATDLSEDIQQKLNEVGDAQLKSKGRITRPTAVIIDKSGSMNVAIEIGKRLGSMVSAIMDATLYVYACDTMAYPIETEYETSVKAGPDQIAIPRRKSDLASWEKAFKGINASGGTSCGVGIDMMRRNKQRVEQIVMVTDEGENTSPPFLTSLQNYIKEMGVTPHIVFLKCGHAVSTLEERCRNNSIDFDAYTFNGDYYSLPNLVQYLTKPSKVDLLMDIMSYPLPQRRAA
jgi:hypothetical protein